MARSRIAPSSGQGRSRLPYTYTAGRTARATSAFPATTLLHLLVLCAGAQGVACALGGERRQFFPNALRTVCTEKRRQQQGHHPPPPSPRGQRNSTWRKRCAVLDRVMPLGVAKVHAVTWQKPLDSFVGVSLPRAPTCPSARLTAVCVAVTATYRRREWQPFDLSVSASRPRDVTNVTRPGGPLWFASGSRAGGGGAFFSRTPRFARGFPFAGGAWLARSRVCGGGDGPEKGCLLSWVSRFLSANRAPE